MTARVGRWVLRSSFQRGVRSLLRLLHRKLLPGEAARRGVVDAFHDLYYDAGAAGDTWSATTWYGVPTQKLPSDLWVYQEMLHELRPDLIVETGTAAGGSALYLAQVCDVVGRGRVVTVDVADRDDRPRHPRITYVHGSSVAPDVVAHVRSLVRSDDEVVLVILDSDHGRDHVAAELDAYHDLVGVGSYVVVEDTNVNGHPVAPEFGPGPHEAVQSFLAAHPEFEVDRSREKFLLTFNPGGYLRRVR